MICCCLPIANGSIVKQNLFPYTHSPWATDPHLRCLLLVFLFCIFSFWGFRKCYKFIIIYITVKLGKEENTWSLGALPSTVSCDSLQCHRIVWQSFMVLMFDCSQKWKQFVICILVPLCGRNLFIFSFFSFFFCRLFFTFIAICFSFLRCNAKWDAIQCGWSAKTNKSKPPINTSRHRVRLITISISNTQLAIFRNIL